MTNTPHSIRLASIALTVALGHGPWACAQASESAPPTRSAAKVDLPDGRALLDKAIDAMGGREAFDRIESMRVKATLTFKQGSLELVNLTARPNRFHISRDMDGQHLGSAGCDGTIGWVNQRGEYRLLAAEEIEEALAQSNIFGTLPNFEKQYDSMETVERSTFGEEPAYKVRMSGGAGAAEQFVFFHTENGRLLGTQQDSTTEQGATVRMKFLDWKTLGELTVYSRIVFTQGEDEAIMTLDEIEFNTVDARAFAPPDQVLTLARARERNSPSAVPQPNSGEQPAAPSEPATDGSETPPPTR